MIDKFVDWSRYWDECIVDQIMDIEDYEPKTTNTDYKMIKQFMESPDIELMLADCEVQKDGVLIFWGLGGDEDGVCMGFFIGTDDIIKHVEFR